MGIAGLLHPRRYVNLGPLDVLQPGETGSVAESRPSIRPPPPRHPTLDAGVGCKVARRAPRYGRSGPGQQSVPDRR
jgi:hypothetical protein